jgi:glycosyltransferase involved in cell wall biosynthesis
MGISEAQKSLRSRGMRVSVVVPAYNEEAGLGASLRSIRSAMSAFDRRGWWSELVVCDNNSTDRTADVARAAGASVVFEPINQIARARNTGAAHATGDWLIFIDADSHPSADLFADVASEIVRGRCIAGGSTIVFDDTKALVRVATWLWNALSRINRWAAGSCVFCETVTFLKIGGFNQDLYAGEEIDLFRRLKPIARQQGKTLVILYRHPLRTSARKLHLYSWREITMFVLKTIAGGGRTLRNVNECFAWYDGRR